MVAEFSLDEDVGVGDTPPSDRPKRRGRRTKAELLAAGMQPKERVSRAERWTRYAEVFATFYSINAFIPGKYALNYYDRDEVAKLNGVDSERIPMSELERFSRAFDNYQAADARLHRLVENFLTKSPGITFAVVCVSLALPRLEMAGLLPWMPKRQIEQQPEQEPTTVPNQNGTTPFQSGPIGAPTYDE